MSNDIAGFWLGMLLIKRKARAAPSPSDIPASPTAGALSEPVRSSAGQCTTAQSPRRDLRGDKKMQRSGQHRPTPVWRHMSDTGLDDKWRAAAARFSPRHPTRIHPRRSRLYAALPVFGAPLGRTAVSHRRLLALRTTTLFMDCRRRGFCCRAPRPVPRAGSVRTEPICRRARAPAIR
jgi:hypothetical protein